MPPALSSSSTCSSLRFPRRCRSVLSSGNPVFFLLIGRSFPVSRRENEPKEAPFQRPEVSSVVVAPLVAVAAARRRREVRIADAAVKADPVDAGRTAPGVSIAQVNPPQGRVRLGDELSGVHHRTSLPLFAALLPLAVDSDVENHRVIEGRHRRRLWLRTDQRQQGQSNFRPHDVKTDIGGAKPQVTQIKTKTNVTIMIHSRHFTCLNDESNLFCVQPSGVGELCYCCNLIFYLLQSASELLRVFGRGFLQ